MRFIIGLSVATALSLTLVGSASAQSASGNINAIAVVRQPIVIAAGQDLDFGIVMQGTPKTVAQSAASAGRFDATGTASANVNIDFTLPANLTSGANTLPIGTWTGCFNGTANNNTVGCTAIANLAATTATAFGAAGNLWVFVGATVTPAAAQAVGNYSAPVTLTLTYF